MSWLTIGKQVLYQRIGRRDRVVHILCLLHCSLCYRWQCPTKYRLCNEIVLDRRSDAMCSCVLFITALVVVDKSKQCIAFQIQVNGTHELRTTVIEKQRKERVVVFLNWLVFRSMKRRTFENSHTVPPWFIWAVRSNFRKARNRHSVVNRIWMNLWENDLMMTM